MHPKVYKNKGLEVILSARGRCLYVGAETEQQSINPAIRRYLSPGCERLVLYRNGKPISGIQIMIQPFNCTIANVYTMPSKRRKGYAKQLWEEAKKHHPLIFHSRNLSPDGEIFSTHCK